MYLAIKMHQNDSTQDEQLELAKTDVCGQNKKNVFLMKKIVKRCMYLKLVSIVTQPMSHWHELCVDELKLSGCVLKTFCEALQTLYLSGETDPVNTCPLFNWKPHVIFGETATRWPTQVAMRCV